MMIASTFFYFRIATATPTPPPCTAASRAPSRIPRHILSAVPPFAPTICFPDYARQGWKSLMSEMKFQHTREEHDLAYQLEDPTPCLCTGCSSTACCDNVSYK